MKNCVQVWFLSALPTDELRSQCNISENISDLLMGRFNYLGLINSNIINRKGLGGGTP